MLVEFSIIPLGKKSIRNDVAEALKIVDASGLPYQLTATGTVIEGDWPEIMRVIEQCHQRARKDNDYVITNIKIEDEAGVKDQLFSNVQSIEQTVGRKLQKEPKTRRAA